MTSSLLTYADLLLRIVKLEARVISLEQQVNERGAAPKIQWIDCDDVLLEMSEPRAPHWVLGEGGGSTPTGTK